MRLRKFKFLNVTISKLMSNIRLNYFAYLLMAVLGAVGFSINCLQSKPENGKLLERLYFEI